MTGIIAIISSICESETIQMPYKNLKFLSYLGNWLAWLGQTEALPLSPPVKRPNQWGTLKWLLASEPLEEKPVPLAQNRSFIRWVFAKETLETKPAPAAKAKGFWRTFFEKETLS